MDRKIFLDIGAYDGMSAEFFRKNHPEGRQFEIFSFECDLRNIEIIKKRIDLKINLIPKAAWIFYGYKNYYYGKDDGGSFYKDKTTGSISPTNYYLVETIDLAKFIHSNFIKEDYIIMKMNCEGAEYELITHLHKNNLIDWIDKWYVQWHYEKIGLSLAEHERITKMIPEFYDWEVQFGDIFIEKFKQSL